MTEPDSKPDSPLREEQLPDAPPPAALPRWRPAAEPTCCGSDCEDCPF